MDDRIPTALWVDAHLRKCAAEAIPAYVINKGAYASGTVLVKLNNLEGSCVLLVQQRDLEGNLGWMYAGGQEERLAEKEADAYIRRSIDRDPDVWVIEIEDREMNNPFEGRII